MLVTATDSGPALTATGVFVIASSGVTLLWLIVLSVTVLRRLRRPYDAGTPVYQRMPDGRVRFSWGIAGGLGKAQRMAAVVDLRSRQPADAPVPITADGGAHARH